MFGDPEGLKSSRRRSTGLEMSGVFPQALDFLRPIPVFHAGDRGSNALVKARIGHWYEAHGIGKKEFKRKRYLDSNHENTFCCVR